MFLRRRKRSLKERAQALIFPPSGYKRAGRYYMLRLKRRPGTPEYIAKGFAFGVAMNYCPILFTHWLGGYLLCRIFSGDVLAMIVGTLLGNPWTYALVYPLCYKLGKTLMGLHTRHRYGQLLSIDDVWHQIWPVTSWHSLTIVFQEILVPMLMGGFLLALPSAFLAYFVARNAIRVYRGQHRRTITRQFHVVEEEIEHRQPEFKE